MSKALIFLSLALILVVLIARASAPKGYDFQFYAEEEQEPFWNDAVNWVKGKWDSYTFTLGVDGQPTSMTCTISAGDTYCKSSETVLVDGGTLRELEVWFDDEPG